MKTYYLEKDNKIVLHDTDEARIKRTLKFLPQYADLELKETERPIENFEWADTQEYITKKHKQDVQNEVDSQEKQTGLIRPIREMVLAEGSGASEYSKSKAQEIEDLAQELRK